MRNLRKCSDDPVWHRICDEQEMRCDAWIEKLRALGVKGAHPNDGWVNREDDYASFVYPYFDDGIEEGAIIVLGSPSDAPGKSIWAVVIAVKNQFARDTLGYKFMRIEDPEMLKAKRKSCWLQRFTRFLHKSEIV